jgi:holin-like protein
VIESLTVLLVCQLIGELAARTLQFPVPGPVVGLVLLFIVLRLRGSVSDSLRQSAAMLHGHMSLLFVPAGVGVMLYYPQLAREWLLILVSVVVSTLIGIGVTAWVLGALVDRRSSDASERDSR